MGSCLDPLLEGSSVLIQIQWTKIITDSWVHNYKQEHGASKIDAIVPLYLYTASTTIDTS